MGAGGLWGGWGEVGPRGDGVATRAKPEDDGAPMTSSSLAPKLDTRGREDAGGLTGEGWGDDVGPRGDGVATRAPKPLTPRCGDP